MEVFCVGLVLRIVREGWDGSPSFLLSLFLTSLIRYPKKEEEEEEESGEEEEEEQKHRRALSLLSLFFSLPSQPESLLPPGCFFFSEKKREKGGDLEENELGWLVGGSPHPGGGALSHPIPTVTPRPRLPSRTTGGMTVDTVVKGERGSKHFYFYWDETTLHQETDEFVEL